MAKQGIFSALASLALDALAKATRSSRGGSAPTRPRRAPAVRPTGAVSRVGAVSVARRDDIASPGSPEVVSTQTVELDPLRVPGLELSYRPDRDGDPDGGEIIWTWVPYAENDGRGKDRPVLVIGRQGADRVYAVKLTSKSHDGDREYVSIGSGAWDAQGRESWVDLDQLYSVHADGMRREAAALDRDRFGIVAEHLRRRYGWRTAG